MGGARAPRVSTSLLPVAPGESVAEAPLSKVVERYASAPDRQAKALPVFDKGTTLAALLRLRHSRSFVEEAYPAGFCVP